MDKTEVIAAARYVNVSNPAVIGCEVLTGSIRAQFYVLRGVDGVRMAMHTVHAGRWVDTGWVTAPERFGAQPTDYKSLRSWCEAFNLASLGGE